MPGQTCLTSFPQSMLISSPRDGELSRAIISPPAIVVKRIWPLAPLIPLKMTISEGANVCPIRDSEQKENRDEQAARTVVLPGCQGTAGKGAGLCDLEGHELRPEVYHPRQSEDRRSGDDQGILYYRGDGLQGGGPGDEGRLGQCHQEARPGDDRVQLLRRALREVSDRAYRHTAHPALYAAQLKASGSGGSGRPPHRRKVVRGFLFAFDDLLRFLSAPTPLYVVLPAGGVSPKNGGNGAEERGVSGRRSWTEAHGGRGLMDAERRLRLNGPKARARGE